MILTYNSASLIMSGAFSGKTIIIAAILSSILEGQGSYSPENRMILTAPMSNEELNELATYLDSVNDDWFKYYKDMRAKFLC
jgi:hypothetical protein